MYGNYHMEIKRMKLVLEIDEKEGMSLEMTKVTAGDAVKAITMLEIAKQRLVKKIEDAGLYMEEQDEG